MGESVSESVSELSWCIVHAFFVSNYFILIPRYLLTYDFPIALFKRTSFCIQNRYFFYVYSWVLVGVERTFISISFIPLFLISLIIQ